MNLSLDTFLPFRLARLSEAVSQEMRDIYHARHGLTRADWRALAWLAKLGEANASELAARSAMHKTKVSRAVRRLEQRRWLSRETLEDDRRVETLRLTAAGHRAFAEISAPLLAREAGLMERLSKLERAELAAALDALERALKVENGTPPESPPARQGKGRS